MSFAIAETTTLGRGRGASGGTRVKVALAGMLGIVAAARRQEPKTAAQKLPRASFTRHSFASLGHASLTQHKSGAQKPCRQAREFVLTDARSNSVVYVFVASMTQQSFP
eukprot:2920946-Amphidinium_carterae.1